jgi:hypothetical protein
VVFVFFRIPHTLNNALTIVAAMCSSMHGACKVIISELNQEAKDATFRDLFCSSNFREPLSGITKQ